MKKALSFIKNIRNKFKKSPCCIIHCRKDGELYKMDKDWFKDRSKCPFCLDENIVKNIYKTENIYILKNIYPYAKTEEHILIIPYRHIRSWGKLNQAELNDIKKQIDLYLDKWYILLWRQFKRGNRSWSSIHHLHIHLILNEK